MSSLTLSAPAKLNLTLDILGTRPDGYHEMEMVEQSVSLCDEIHLHLGFPGGIRAESGRAFCPMTRATWPWPLRWPFGRPPARSWTDLRISIEKRIPVCAGTAGRSSDARRRSPGLNLLTNAGLSLQDLARIGAAVGSDVPYCVLGGHRPGPGTGGNVNPAARPCPPACSSYVSPGFPSPPLPCFGNGTRKGAPSPPGYQGNPGRLGTRGPAGDCPPDVHVFEGVLPPHQHREIEAIKHTMIQAGALGAAMSGSGPTVFGIFSQASQAQEAWAQLREDYDEVFLAEPLVQNSIP